MVATGAGGVGGGGVAGAGEASAGDSFRDRQEGMLAA